MPTWIKTRPDDKAYASELAVARRFEHLPADWLVIWGYYYANDRGGPLDREGDFIVLDGAGRLLVLEVKGSGYPMRLAADGTWQDPSREDPRKQLNAECASVIAHVCRPEKKPWPAIRKALVYPSLKLDASEMPGAGWEDTLILDDDALAHFTYWWEDAWKDVPPKKNGAQIRDNVIAVFGTDAKPQAAVDFLRLSDHLLHKRAGREFVILDQLADNPRIRFTGGPGTGKALIAMAAAQRLADSGLDVLYPIFHLPLKAEVQRYFRENPPRAGSVVVCSQADAAKLLLGDAFPQPPPADADHATKSRYYDGTLRTGILAHEGPPASGCRFDALVVDEAQDHDTHWSAQESTAPGNTGWWGVFVRLLRDPANAPAILSLDPEARSDVLAPGDFSLEVLDRIFPGLVRVNLRTVVRYTQQIHDFIETGSVVHDERLRTLLPSGPRVIVRNADSAAKARDIVAEILRRWLADGIIANPGEVLLISPRRTWASTSLAGWSGADLASIVDYDENATGPQEGFRHLNLLRAKGLDEKAVVVLDIESPSASANPDRANRWLRFSASRARLALAVVFVPREALGGNG